MVGMSCVGECHVGLGLFGVVLVSARVGECPVLVSARVGECAVLVSALCW